MGDEILIKTNTINISNIPTKIFTVGGDVDSLPNEVILIIPGNYYDTYILIDPLMLDFVSYVNFMHNIIKCFKLIVASVIRKGESISLYVLLC